jgi:hypothetical protein
MCNPFDLTISNRHINEVCCLPAQLMSSLLLPITPRYDAWMTPAWTPLSEGLLQDANNAPPPPWGISRTAQTLYNPS